MVMPTFILRSITKPNHEAKQERNQMPTGPQGQKRPADVVGCAVRVMKIATGEIEENLKGAPKRQPGRARSGKAGGRARADSLTPERRSEIARAAATARWGE